MVAAARVDPVKLASFVFGHDHWPLMGDIMRSVFTPYSRTAVKGCHASGKTFTAADIIPIALLLGGDVITTAPTDDQVRGQLWRQVNINLRDSRIPLSEWGETNQTEIRLPTGERAFGRSTNQGVRFQGEHARPGRFLIVIVDEGPGVLAAVMGAIEGMRAGGDVRLLIQGNPLESAGFFYDIFATERSGWNRFSISAFDTPNLMGLTIDDVLAMSPDELDTNERPYLITRRYVREKYEEWGPDYWEYQGRVLAQFPDQAEDALLAGSWIDAAASRRLADTDAGIVAGIDVAGPGEDETVLCLNRGGDIVAMQGWAHPDPRADVLGVLRPWINRGLKVVNVDSVGVGWYFYLDIKNELEPFGIAVNPINVAESSDTLDELGNRRYANLKADLYWNAREKFANGDVRGLVWEQARVQLRSLRYTTPRGVITIESKEDLRKRMGEGHSPDWAEALILSLWPGRTDLTALYGTGRVVPGGKRAQYQDWRQAVG